MASVIVLGVIALAVALDFATAAPGLCASCHEMKPRAESWGESAHAAVACVKCHQTPQPWYAVPARLIDRGQLLVRDTVSHFSGDYDDPVDAAIAGTTPVPDEICLQCHDPNRKATSGFRILIDHAEHAKRNGSCVSCHVRTAHPSVSRGRELSLMAQCFTCHGTAEKPEASADCDVCHPSDYRLVPASHEDAEWAETQHGAVAKDDPPQCGMCHAEKFCSDCHGLAMPHPEGWAKGETGHAVIAEQRRAVCARCHGDTPDMCTICHHEDYDPAGGPWVVQHPFDVSTRGTASCFECHGPTFCIECHTR